jgi:glycosyltransferase involved in cell wall biosynthesis
VDSLAPPHPEKCVTRSSVSVVIPTFNRREQLALALNSVISQTVKLHEIVVVDDGSTDGTPEMLNEFVRLNPDMRILVIRQENRGPSSARNAGIKVATGDLVAFLDDDDTWHPEKMERQLAVLAARTDIFLLGCATDTLKLTGGSRVVDIGEWNLIFRNWFLTPGVVARRDVLIASGGFPEDMRHCEDYALWLRIASGHKCAFLNEVLVGCGHGKPTFGHSGLSADLDALHSGELDALARWGKERNPGVAMSALTKILASIRHLRRRIIAARN